jgi:hypothetical protein
MNFLLSGIKTTRLFSTTVTSQNQNCCIPKPQPFRLSTVLDLGCNSSGFKMSQLRQKMCSFDSRKPKTKGNFVVKRTKCNRSYYRVPKLHFRKIKIFVWRLPLRNTPARFNELIPRKCFCMLYAQRVNLFGMRAVLCSYLRLISRCVIFCGSPSRNWLEFHI